MLNLELPADVKINARHLKKSTGGAIWRILTDHVSRNGFVPFNDKSFDDSTIHKCLEDASITSFKTASDKEEIL